MNAATNSVRDTCGAFSYDIDDECEVSCATDTPVIARTQAGRGHADGMKSWGRGDLPCDRDCFVLGRTRNDNRTRTASFALGRMSQGYDMFAAIEPPVLLEGGPFACQVPGGVLLTWLRWTEAVLRSPAGSAPGQR